MSSDFGIVTLCDENYFPGLLMLHRSVQESLPCPIACFDIGLSIEQKAHAAALRNLMILPLPADPLIPRIQAAMRAASPLQKPNKRVWPLWICPVLIKHAPFRDVIWMDCDLVVLRDLGQLFAAIEAGPLFTPENNAPHATPNRAALYELLPIRRPFDPQKPAVNGGVSGWRKDRDAAVLEAYILPVERAAADLKVRDAIAWHDQGALIWAIQCCGLEHRVAPTNDWNLCVRHTPLADHPIAWGDGFLDTARATVANANIIHWNGHPPPWLRPAPV
jgi:hypothetical protein